MGDRKALEITPGDRVGPFVLGTPIKEVVSILTNNKQRFSEIHLSYSDQRPLIVDTIIDVTTHGIQLQFDGKTQQLKQIDVYDSNKVSLEYESKSFNFNKGRATLRDVYGFFNVAPLDYDRTHKRYWLNCKSGLAISFPVPADLEEVDGSVVLTKNEWTFKNGKHPRMSSLVVLPGGTGASNGRNGGALPRPVAFPHYQQIVEVNRDRGMLTFTEENKSVQFGDSCQDVVSTLGPPSEKYFKAEDKMNVHSSQHEEISRADYLFNYFDLGVDILFDAEDHRVSKFIMHSNIPGHFDFNRYNRCNFRVVLDEEPPLPSASPFSPTNEQFFAEEVVNEQPRPSGLGLLDTPLSPPTPRTAAREHMAITCITKFSEVQQYLSNKMGDEPPVTFQRPKVINTTDPFPPTVYYGYKRLLFEVMANDHIATLSMYRRDN